MSWLCDENDVPFMNVANTPSFFVNSLSMAPPILLLLLLLFKILMIIIIIIKIIEVWLELTH